MCDEYWIIGRRTSIGTFEYWTGYDWTQYPDQAERYDGQPVDLAQQLDGLLFPIQEV